jgi:MFS family permease
VTEQRTRPRLGPRYWRLWTAGTVSNFGDGVNAVALPLFAATITRDPRLIAGMAVAATLPWLVFALPAGAIVDRLDRKRLMWRVNVVRSLLVAVIALSATTGVTSILLLYTIVLAMGVCETLFDNAAQSVLPSIVERELLETANGRQYAAEVVTNQFAGPPVGGLLFAAAASLPFWVNSSTYVASAVLIASIAGSFRPRQAAGAPEGAPQHRSLRSDIAEGVRWLRGHRLLRTLALLLGVLNLTTTMAIATLVLFAQDELGVTTRGFGVLLAGVAVGSVVGGLVGAKVARALGQAKAIVLAAFITSAIQVVVGGLSSPVLVAVLLSVSGLFGVVWNIITVSLRQSIIPDHLLGRVNSVYRFLAWGGMPVGALIGGFLANAYGLRVPWFVGGSVALGALALSLPVLRQRTIDEARAEADRIRP